MSLTLSLTNGKAQLGLNGVSRDIPKSVLVEVYQILLSQVCPDRDYTSVTSCTKLLKIFNLEFEPDESDDDASGEATKAAEPEPEPPAAKATSAPTSKAAPAPSAGRGRKAPVKAAAKPAAKTAAKKDEPEESESSSAEDS